MDTNIPKHVAIILDGNGTWAKKHGYNRNVGHRKGARNLVDITNSANKLGIKHLTVYAFSTENWSRPKSEVDYLMRLFKTFIKNQKENVIKNNVKLRVIGSKNNLDNTQIKLIEEIEDISKNNTGININVCFNYGSYDELTNAVKKIITNKHSVDEVNPSLIEKYLYTYPLPPVDLLIRTSGQQRLSNFLLWQVSYSELYFTNTLWPDFNEEELIKAINAYSNRDRRFGGLKC